MGNTTKSTFRTVLMLPFAAIVTAGLFLFMGGMIQTEGQEYKEPKPRPVVTFDRKIIETETFTDNFPKPDVPHQPTPQIPQTEWPLPKTGGEGTPVIGPDLGKGGPVVLPKGLGLTGVILSQPPEYPNSCLARGVEGTATVVFDVTNSGHVINARVVGATDRCFERAAIRAIQKWKFRAQGDGGAGISQRNLRKTFTFEITE